MYIFFVHVDTELFIPGVISVNFHFKMLPLNKPIELYMPIFTLNLFSNNWDVYSISVNLYLQMKVI